VANSNGQQSVGWHFALDAAQSDQIVPSQVLSQSYQVALSDGGQGLLGARFRKNSAVPNPRSRLVPIFCD
jgi:hypothetical protein